MGNEIILGIYLAFHPRVDRDGWWTQEDGGFANKENRYSVAASISYRFGKTELMFADAGRFSQMASFVSDSNYDARSENGCDGECEQTRWGYNSQRSQVVALSRTIGDRAFIKIGSGIMRMEWDHRRHDSADGTGEKRFSYSLHQVEYNLATVIGAGFYFGEWRAVGSLVRASYRLREHDYQCCPPAREVWMIGIEK